MRARSALQRLQPLVGAWNMKGHFIGSDAENITGQANFEWLEGGFFPQQDVKIDLGGKVHVKSRKLIGFDPQTRAFSSHVYSNLSLFVSRGRCWKTVRD